MEYSRDTPPGSISFYVHGAPKGKGRPRFTQAGITYTPDDTRIYEERVIAAYLEQVGTSKQRPYFPKDKPLVLEAVIDFAPPKSASKKKKLQMLAGEIRPIRRPDADNVLKAIADSLNGLAYHDDAQLVEMKGTKRYDAIEGVWVLIYPA